VGVFLSMRTGRWPVAIGCAFLAGLLRPVGALLAVPMAIEAARALKVERRAALRRLLAATAPLAGTAVYLGWVGARFGNALLPFQLQQQSYLRGGVANPLLALVRSGRDLIAGTMEPNGMHFAWAVLFVLLVLAAFRHWPASYGAFAAVSLVAALSAQRLGSLERYGFGAFPIVLALASLTARPWSDRASLVLSGAGLFAYANLAFLNIYVP